MTDKITAPSRGLESGASSLQARGDALFAAGCMLAGSLVLGLVGAIVALIGLYVLRKADRAEVLDRPWALTFVAGWILLESAIRYIGFGFDLLPTHNLPIVRSLWIDYGMFVDGGYALHYNLPRPLHYNSAAIGGISVPIEKSIQIAGLILVLPIRIAAAWGLLKMKRWGLQWSIVGCWMYLTLSIIGMAAMANQFELRFGSSEFGVIGYWLVTGLPLLGSVVILPYLHSVNRRAFDD